MLVCCTGGEEGDLQNPTLREPGQPFHGLTPEEEQVEGRVDAGARAGRIGRDHRLRRGRDARLPRLGHGRDRAERASRLLPPGRHRRGHRPAGGDHPPRASAGDHHLRRRPAAATRIPITCGCTTSRCWRSSGPATPTGTRTLGEPVRPVEAVLLGVVEGPDPGHPRADAAGEGRVAVRAGLARSAVARPSHHHPDRHRAATATCVAGRCGRTPRRSTRSAAFWGFEIDEDEFTAAYPWEDWILARSLVGPIPADDGERDLFAGVSERVAP